MEGRTRACRAVLRAVRFVSILVFTGHRAQSREGGICDVHTSFFDDCRRCGLVLRSRPYRRMPLTTSRQKCRCATHATARTACPIDPKTIPIIWGQQQSYLVKQLRDYRNGERDNPIMSPIAKALAQEDLRKIAAYFAAKSWPAQRRPPPRRRRPTESPSASPAISPISRAARRRRGWRGSATNTWSQRCATSPPMKGPTTATCRNSCKR